MLDFPRSGQLMPGEIQSGFCSLFSVMPHAQINLNVSLQLNKICVRVYVPHTHLKSEYEHVACNWGQNLSSIIIIKIFIVPHANFASTL